MTKSQGIGGHQATVGKTDIWLTPKYVLDTLGSFDLDPCAAPSPRLWDTARRHIELPEDGLTVKWEGRVWMNPPYSEVALWIAKLARHGNGVALIFARTEVRFWHRDIWPKASGILFLEGRLTFLKEDGSKPVGNSGAPSVLVAYSEYNAKSLRDCGLPGKFIKLP